MALHIFTVGRLCCHTFDVAEMDTAYIPVERHILPAIKYYHIIIDKLFQIGLQSLTPVLTESTEGRLSKEARFRSHNIRRNDSETKQVSFVSYEASLIL